MAQKYQVLARKYRPQAFRDVVGQEAAVTTLKNAIRFDKVAHAYLFCGSRGVGKTTLARLFAKALNCHALTPQLEPCNECPSCLEILSGQSLDVIEIDGASNRGIDDIRQINETVGYAPSHGKYKIYIIDEVHMLTKEAFNALLKTLEEPPQQAKFFFATTEAHKVLPTIISRCQRFDLARIQPSLIAAKLQQIATDLDRPTDPEALQLIATFSEGSLRDAESLFDQILCFSDTTITAATVRQSLGLVPQELFSHLDQAFSEYRLSYAFELVDQLFQAGKDLAHFLEQLVEHYRNLTLARTLNTPHPSARFYTQQQCLHILDLLLQAEASFQKSPYPRITLESTLLQIIRSRHRIPIEVLVRRLTEKGETLNAECKTEEGVVPTASVEKMAVESEPVASPSSALSLKPVPFKPFEEKPQPPTPVQKIATQAEPVAPPSSAFSIQRSAFHDTLLRFTAVELEGTVKI
jgi:DNA polymerase-3 subunit gamma/tau